jgi:hypothetical protein
MLYISVDRMGWAAPAAAERKGTTFEQPARFGHLEQVEKDRIFYLNRL